MTKSHVIDVCAHMYSLHPESNIYFMNEDTFWINEFQVMMGNIGAYLNDLGIDSRLYQRSFEKFNMFEGVEETGLIEQTGEHIAVKIHVDNKLAECPQEDPYRDHMLSIDYDLVWFPANVQINNVFTKGQKFNSFWTSKLFYKNLIKSLETATESDYKNGIIVQNHLVIFDESKFESNRVDIVY